MLVVSLSCCDALHAMLATEGRGSAVGPGTLRAPDTRAPPPSSRPALAGPRSALGGRGATAAALQRHGSAPALVPVLASAWAVTRKGQTPTPTPVGARPPRPPGTARRRGPGAGARGRTHHRSGRQPGSRGAVTPAPPSCARGPPRPRLATAGSVLPQRPVRPRRPVTAPGAVRTVQGCPIQG